MMDNLVASHLKIVSQLCRDEHALADAQEIVPVANLIQDHLEIIDASDYRDKLLPFVVNWFANEFFTWFHRPDCEKCSQEMQYGGLSTSAEGKRIEHYHCVDCANSSYDFVRHNEPAILLRTRRGRCGEYAICFMLILKSLGYDTRLVIDVNDHVWNEVWSDSEGRWVHVDSCEQAVDLPLLYEVGWGKKLDFCIALSEFQVLDVTPRYVIDFEQTKLKRKEKVDELQWHNHLDHLSDTLLSSAFNLTDVEVLKINERRTGDKEFLANVAKQPQIVDRNKYTKRKSGGLEWRIQRGEYCVAMKPATIINPTKSQSPCDTNLFDLSYCSLSDCYKSSMSDYDKKKKWSSLVYEYANLDYKYERDWKTAYLSRYESCQYEETAKIAWRFDLSNLSCERWTKMIVDIAGKVYEHTWVTLQLSIFKDREFAHEDKNIILELNKCNTIARDVLGTDAIFIQISAALSGGIPEDEVAWQKPQLFRSTRSVEADSKRDFRVQIL